MNMLNPPPDKEPLMRVDPEFEDEWLGEDRNGRVVGSGDSVRWRPGHVTKHYSDTRPIYMPPVAVDIIKKIQAQKKEE